MNNSDLITESISFINTLDTGRCYVVGGYLRNALMGKESYDIDLVLGKPEAVKIFADRFNCNYYVVGGGRLHRVVRNDITFDFSVITDSIEDDLAKRDFTCDSMAVSLDKLIENNYFEDIIDPFLGISDIKSKLLRLTSGTSLSDDRVRIIRAYRLRKELGFEFSLELESMISKSASGLNNEKSERIRQELEKLFNMDNIGSILEEMQEKGIFSSIHLYQARTESVENIQKRLEDSKLPATIRFIVILAAIWNNMGISVRLKMSTHEKRLLKEVLSTDKDIFNSWIKFGSMAESIYTAKYVLTADQVFLGITEKYRDKLESQVLPSLLSGKEIMELLGIGPSPTVGRIIKNLQRAQFEGRISTTGEAWQYVKSKQK